MVEQNARLLQEVLEGWEGVPCFPKEVSGIL